MVSIIHSHKTGRNHDRNFRSEHKGGQTVYLRLLILVARRLPHRRQRHRDSNLAKVPRSGFRVQRTWQAGPGQRLGRLQLLLVRIRADWRRQVLLNGKSTRQLTIRSDTAQTKALFRFHATRSSSEFVRAVHQPNPIRCSSQWSRFTTKRPRTCWSTLLLDRKEDSKSVNTSSSVFTCRI